MSHTLIALALQAIIAIPSGNWWAGAAAGAFYFIGREINRGTATLLNGTASIVVNHGLANTPALGDILATPQTSDGTATATTVTIFMGVDRGKNVPFSWHAQIN